MSMGAEKRNLTIANVNVDDPEELARFREEQAKALAERKQAVLAELRRRGQMDEDGNFIFKEPTPADMLPESLADFKH